MLSLLWVSHAYPMYQHEETIIIFPGNKENGSLLTDSQSQLSHSGPSIRQTPGADLPMEVICHSRQGVWDLTHRKFHAFLIPNDVFLLFNMTNEIKITSLKHRIEPKFDFLRLLILTHSNKISCILHNTRGIVLKFSHMMWIILNLCLITEYWNCLT